MPNFTRFTQRAASSFVAGIMAAARDERLVLIGIGAFTFAVVNAMVTFMRLLRDDKEIRAAPPAAQYITQETEDALPFHTLELLVAHPNDSVRETATKIVCDRAVNDDHVIDHLLYGITREDYESREKCLRALEFLVRQNGDCLAKLHSPKAYPALVRALELSLGDREIPTLNDNRWDEYPMRDVTERLPLYMLSELAHRYGPVMLVQAKLVPKWLAKQPWGDTVAERRTNFRDYVEFKSHNRVAKIIMYVRDCPAGHRALQRAGLVKTPQPSPPTSSTGRDPQEPGPDGPDGLIAPEMRQANDFIRFVDRGDGTEVPGFVPATLSVVDGQLRLREQSAEEVRLRRMHREAMVLNDGTRPLGRDNIIERDLD